MTRLKVAVRVRPLSKREIDIGSTSVISVENGDTLEITNLKVHEQNTGDSRQRIRRFAFDSCFQDDSSQEQVFESIEKVISKSIKHRCHSCVLAYGQSSTGKTHTMMGIPEDPGITPKLCDRLFEYLQDAAVGNEILDNRVTVSYLEIYNEKVRDLLCDEETDEDKLRRKKTPLKVREHPKKGPYVQAEQSTKQKGLRRKFVPYRDSVLTWLLKDILGGNSNTFMVATVSPSSACYSETINTLRFGQRAKNIVARPVVNEDPKEKTIRELRAEIYRLREVLEGLKIPPPTPMNDKFDEHPAEEPDKAIDEPRTSTPSLDKPQTESVELHSIPTQVKSSDQERTRSILTNTERLLPLIDVTTSTVKAKRLARLRRTSTVKMDAGNVNAFGSDDSLSRSVPSATPSSESISSRRSSVAIPPLRRKSLNKSVQSLPKRGPTVVIARRMEKAVSTDHLPPKTVESKVDSIRRRPAKPRSQIVAAVTSRLYSKPKNKEASTDTDDINTYELGGIAPKELQICENARNRLKEITRRALRAHRSRNEETQTDIISARRVKETATDVSDLRWQLLEVREAETMCEPVPTMEAAVSCGEASSTRSCGTQSEDRPREPMSFTKYLRDIQDDLPPNPIYANSVNIKISNNYLGGGEKVSSITGPSESREELDQPAACLPTPDLLSDHNSLEHNQAAKEAQKLLHESVEEIEDVFTVAEACPSFDVVDGFDAADCGVAPNVCSSRSSVKLTKTFATEIMVDSSCESEFCLPLPAFEPSKAVPQVTDAEASTTIEDVVVVKEPLVLKSIVKTEEPRGALMDSLDYHRANKKVRFAEDRRGDQERMFHAVSSFLEEATRMMSKLEKSTSTSSLVDCDKPIRRAEGVRHPCCPVHRPEKSSQTEIPGTAAASAQCDGLPANRFEVALEDSCKRLEDKMRWTPDERAGSDLEDGPVAFSDYGSLPRRRYTTWSRCSPSAYLRQLTQMRRQIVRSSREDLGDAGLR